MPRWFKSPGRPPEPSGPSVTLRRFQPGDPTVSQDRVAPSADGWVMEAPKTGTVHLFEVGGLQVEQCMLTDRASSEHAEARWPSDLEMWIAFPDGGSLRQRHRPDGRGHHRLDLARDQVLPQEGPDRRPGEAQRHRRGQRRADSHQGRGTAQDAAIVAAIRRPLARQLAGPLIPRGSLPRLRAARRTVS